MKKILLSIIVLSIVYSLNGQTFGNAVDLDGIDDYAVVQHHPSLNPMNGSWSVAFWIKAANKDQIAPVVMKRLPEAPYTQYSYGFGKDDPHNPEPGKRLRVNHIEVPGESERSGYTTEEYIDGDWHHIAFVADKAADGIIIYVDGSPVEFFPLYYYGEWPDVSITNDLIIASGSSGAKIEGPLDELSIWNKALNMGQIQQIMYDTLSSEYYATADSGLVAYYRFDEFEDLGAGNAGTDDFRDLSSFGNHADSEGNPVLIPSGIFVGMEEKPGLDKILLYPNPAKYKFTIECSIFQVEEATLEIFDLHGRKLHEKQIPKGNETIEIDLSTLGSGIYFCKLITEKGNATKKLIIQK
ncbi:MAG: T9SS type A sorting domain-containing protein [Bacteroidetes bacterium]|nr:T9SS type A sorting domain-containing protein [Bacteroidota bacterium]